MRTPLLGDTDVLIEVYAAGINPVDWKIREGLLQDVISYDFPLVLGWDVAGLVAAIGPNVTACKVGMKYIVVRILNETVLMQSTWL